MSYVPVQPASAFFMSSHQASEKQRPTALGRLRGHSRRIAFCILIGALLGFVHVDQTSAADPSVGPVTGLPMPRFVSLKSDKVNLREGPTKEHRTKWIYQRANLPVEIVAESENWRRIRDSDGTEGWVLHSLLIGKRYVLISPWQVDIPVPLYSDESEGARVEAQLMPDVLAFVHSCGQVWCRISGPDFDGYVEKTQLWGVYPDEQFD